MSSEAELPRERSRGERPDREQFDAAVMKVEIGTELLVSRLPATDADIRRTRWLDTLRASQARLAQVIAALEHRR